MDGCLVKSQASIEYYAISYVQPLICLRQYSRSCQVEFNSCGAESQESDHCGSANRRLSGFCK